MKRFLQAAIVLGAITVSAVAQEPNPTSEPAQAPGQGQGPTYYNGTVPVYRVTVVARDIPAVNYFHRSGATKIGFEGTSLLPEAHGSAAVESRRGRLTIDAKFEGLRPANSFGEEYLTYVLWAITPYGRPQNLGEVLPAGSKNEISVSTDLQAFGLIVTAEPYYAVSQPSDVVILQNRVLDKTQGVIEQINAHAQLLPRGMYTHIAGKDAVVDPITRNERSPLELYEAQNAVRIARLAGAKEYASDIFSQAELNLSNALDYDSHKKDRKQTITYAREAVEHAEDARLVSLRKQQALEEQHQREVAQAAVQQSQQAQLQAAQAQAAADRAAAERARAEAEAAEARAQAAQAQQSAQQSVQAASQQIAQMRERLRAQLNSVLQTQETARGLIVNLSDVLFDTGKYTLKIDAREKLAKVSGILLSYPGLKVAVEGYTDNVGGDAFNQKLSDERAGAVRSYLVSQGVADDAVTAQGYGKSNPVADNSTAQGRAQNRRVQLVVSGSAIGVTDNAQGTGAGAALGRSPSGDLQAEPGSSGSGQAGQTQPANTQPAAQGQYAAPQNPQGTSNPPPQQ